MSLTDKLSGIHVKFYIISYLLRARSSLVGLLSFHINFLVRVVVVRDSWKTDPLTRWYYDAHYLS